MAKVWQKGDNKLHPVVEAYEVGADYLLDGKLFKHELASSHAHAKMLNKIGILNEKELSEISREIKRLYKEQGDTIELSISDEDIHSKLENLLTAAIGETGKKIHTGRSRNDQVAVVMRLFEKEKLLKTALLYCEFLEKLSDFARREGHRILPGYTHTKQAMLINVRMWATAFVELGLDNLHVIKSVLELIDSNPLGSGSGFGVPIPLDRDMTADLLGFARVQLNPMTVQNTRGKYEAIIIDTLWNIMNDYSRIAADLLMYNMDEMLFVKTNAAITTGSSIMPQKRNLDVMELVRARANTMLSYSQCVKNIVTGVISGYNKDAQETKEPFFKAFDLIESTIQVVTVVFENIEFDEEAVKRSLSKGIFATDIAFEAVGKGMPFRDAYRLAAQKMDEIEVNDALIKESLQKRNSPGSPETIDIGEYTGKIEQEKSFFKKTSGDFETKLKSLLI